MARGRGFVKAGTKCNKGLKKVVKHIKGKGKRYMCVDR